MTRGGLVFAGAALFMAGWLWRGLQPVPRYVSLNASGTQLFDTARDREIDIEGAQAQKLGEQLRNLGILNGEPAAKPPGPFNATGSILEDLAWQDFMVLLFLAAVSLWVVLVVGGAVVEAVADWGRGRLQLRRADEHWRETHPGVIVRRR